MTRRYGGSTLLQLVAIAVTGVAPRVGVAIVLLAVFFFLIPQPKPRYKPGHAPDETGQTDT